MAFGWPEGAVPGHAEGGTCQSYLNALCWRLVGEYVGGQFTLGAGSPGIDPLTQPVTLQVGAFSITIPAGSFQLDSHGNYVFQGTINGVQLAAGIKPQGGNQYTYGFAGQNATSLPTANPVGIRLAIGSNGGSTSVNANFSP